MFTGSKVVEPVARVDCVGPISAWVLTAAAAVPVSRTATSANEVVNFDFMSSIYLMKALVWAGIYPRFVQIQKTKVNASFGNY